MSKFTSVIICTFNRAELLKRALGSLLYQSINPERFEIVVVDDGSEDTTPIVCDEMRRKFPWFKYVSASTNIGIGSARNLGIRSSVGDYILFTDDDCIAHRDWVGQMQWVLERKPVVAGAVTSPTANFVKLCHNISQFHSVMVGGRRKREIFVAGANMGFNRFVLEELNGFEEGRRIAEDTELMLRIRLKGYQITFASDAIVTHDPQITRLRDAFRYSADHASESILLRNQYGPVLNTPFVLRSPVLILLASAAIAMRPTLSIYLRNRNLSKMIVTAPFVYALKLAWCWGAARGLQSHMRKNER